MNDTALPLPGIMTEEPEPDDRKERRADDARRWFVLTVLVFILIVLVLLMMRSCVPSAVQASDLGGGKAIGRVDPLPEDEFSIAIWCRPGVKAATVLKRHGLSTSGLVKFSDGATVVQCSTGDPDTIVAALKRDKDLYDAGYVFAEDGDDWQWDSAEKKN